MYCILMSAEDSQSTISSDPTLESMSLLGKGFTMAKNNAASGLNYMIYMVYDLYGF